MERLMKWDCDNQWHTPKEGVSGNQVHTALARYEDTGLTPEEIKNLVTINGNLVRANDKLNKRHKHDMETMKELDEALREYQDI